jgi:hypothetical protein
MYCRPPFTVPLELASKTYDGPGAWAQGFDVSEVILMIWNDEYMNQGRNM